MYIYVFKNLPDFLDPPLNLHKFLFYLDFFHKQYCIIVVFVLKTCITHENKYNKGKGIEDKQSKGTIFKIKTGGNETEQMRKFWYRGSIITTDAKCHREIKRRIAIGKQEF